MMVEWVGVLLQRIDQKEKKLKKRIDVKDALMDLFHLVRAWERLAERTNQSLLEWIKSEGKEDELAARQRVRDEAMDQVIMGQQVVSSVGLREQYPSIYSRVRNIFAGTQASSQSHGSRFI